ncbi:MAG: hypothetical protein AB1468_04245 [Candidatus Micrarchaeota archaeon]
MRICAERKLRRQYAASASRRSVCLQFVGEPTNRPFELGLELVEADFAAFERGEPRRAAVVRTRVVCLVFVFVDVVGVAVVREELLGIIPVKEEMGASRRFQLEKELIEKYGEGGMAAYMHVDGQKSAEELRAELGLEEERFIELFEFMEKLHLLKLQTVYEIEFGERKETGVVEEPEEKPPSSSGGS